MIRSMTSYANRKSENEKFSLELSISSVNSRYVEFNLILPDSFMGKKWEIREFLKKRIERGKVSLFMKVKFSKEYLASLVKINKEVVKKYYDEIVSFDLPLSFSFSDILNMPFVKEEISFEITEEDWNYILNELELLLERFFLNADREGRALENDFYERLSLIKSYLEQIEVNVERNIEAHRALLLKRVEKLKVSDIINEERLYKELSFYAENIDYTEEVVRLKSHMEFFNEILSDSSFLKAKRLNFLLQEINREANTIGSKCKDAFVAKYVVLVKEEVEKIREQVQNVW